MNWFKRAGSCSIIGKAEASDSRLRTKKPGYRASRLERSKSNRTHFEFVYSKGRAPALNFRKDRVQSVTFLGASIAIVSL